MNLSRIAVCIAALFNILPIYASSRSADAKVEFNVIDDQGAPVYDAQVEVIFDMLGLGKGSRISTNTDTNGICYATGETAGIINIRVSKEGYYRTHDEVRLIAMGKKRDIKWGKWQPWGMKKKITLPKVRKPIAIPFDSCELRWTNHTNEWIGYDFQINDYVKPFGSGEFADCEIKFILHGKPTYNEYNGLEKYIRFPGAYSGSYWADKFLGSDLQGVYRANKSETYKKDFFFSEKLLRNKRGRPYKRERIDFDQTKVLVVRSRCKVNDTGELISAKYFQIYNISFACDEKGVGIKCGGVYNPTPNDTNIEPKR